MGLIGHSAGESTVVKVAVTADGTPIRDDHFDTAAGDRMVEYVPRSQLRGAVEAIERERDDLQRAVDSDGLGSDMRDIGQLEGLERALAILRGGSNDFGSHPSLAESQAGPLALAHALMDAAQDHGVDIEPGDLDWLCEVIRSTLNLPPRGQ